MAAFSKRPAGRLRHQLGRLIAERPLAAGLAALALGVLAGVLLPAPRREDRLLAG
ncbi:MAG TPA: hypothetical protein VMW75_28550 [Thermoanaerobaculia bacterium]|nr:hypothetical protein [Thermoanaerobaculia bacterium]